MRLHRLTVTAFGPFAGTVEVDLDRVAEGGLFLIRGATGAGKTSLLDAVSFALFADVPGARSKKGLHSDHAERGAVPQVSLEFTADGRRLRLDRSPEFLRPKSRGTGGSRVPAKAVLFEHRHGQWEALSSRHDEIAEIVYDVLGLGMEQFSKVVLLPQGDFAAFLRASPEERRTVLERLFDVATYTGVEDWFALRRKESGSALDGHRTALAGDLGVLVEVLAGAPAVEPAGVQLTRTEWSAVPLGELPHQLRSLHQHLDGIAALRLAELDQARLADAEASRALADATTLVTARTRGLKAQEQLAELTVSQDSYAGAVRLLDAAARAAAVSGDLKAADRARGDVLAARETVLAARARTTALGAQDWSTDALVSMVDRLGAGATTLAAAGHRAVAVGERARRRDQVAAAVTVLRTEAAGLADALDAATAAQDQAVAAVTAARTAEQRLEASAHDLAHVRSLHDLRAQQDDAALAVRRAQDELVVARETAQNLREAYQDLLQARLDGMAGELATRLADGMPCPVCGSQAHPLPASVSGAVPPEQVEQAESRWQQAASGAGKRAERLAGLQAEMAQRAEQLSVDGRDLETLAAALATSGAAHAEIVRHAAQLPELELEADTARAGLTALTDRRAALADEITGLTSAVATMTADLDAELSGLRESLGQHAATCPCGASTGSAPADLAGAAAEVTIGVVDQIRARHDRVTREVQSRIAAERAVDQAETASAATQASLASALAEHGFAGAAAARAAALPATRLAELRGLVAAHQEARARAEAVLADPAVVAALASPEPEIADLARAAEEARAALLATTSAETLARRTLDGLSRVRDSLTRRCEQIGAALAEHEALRELADAVAGTGGSNALRMRLSAFVLAARLETVAALANERLRTMGEGRYQLRHTDGLAARGARSGLGLEVLDLWTGQSRETSTLSGGESFMASLALALGLADAVREESGGFELQTLFVDEGFGTLDDDSLEQVMDVLDGLREGGRAVGVVSHVAELRSRIPNQVVVTKSERGSSVQLQTADEAPAA